MTIKVLRASEPLKVETIVVAIYSNPGLGKSTLGFSCDKPILLDFDGGAYRAANRGDSVQISSWENASNITSDDLAEFNTVVIDTAGRALDFLSMDIIAKNPKMGYGMALTLQGYGRLKSEFTSWLKALRTMGKDIVLIAHSSEEKNGDDIIERLDVQGGSKNEIYKSADAMGRLSLVVGKRVLNFSPTDTSFGKNPACLSPLPVPDIAVEPTFMGDVLATIKEALNTLSEEQVKRRTVVADWQAKIGKTKTVDQYNELIPDIDKVDIKLKPTIKGMLHAAATEAGLVGDKKTKKYKEAE